MTQLTTPLCPCSNPLNGLQSDPTDADLAGMCGACWEREQKTRAQQEEWDRFEERNRALPPDQQVD